MRQILPIVCFIAAVCMSLIDFPVSAVAVLVTAVSAFAVAALIRYFSPSEEKDYLVTLFLTALLARLAFGSYVHYYNLQSFFGGDSITYDIYGNWLSEIWTGVNKTDAIIRTTNSGWGMPYLVAVIYTIVGRNIFAAQCFCGVIGAATAPLVYYCTYQIFSNRRVGRIAALLVAFYPAFIIWSGQLLKDGLIVFLLVLTIIMVLHLQKKFSYAAVFVMILALFGILSLRFYIFYMVAVAAVGSFIVGFSSSTKVILMRLIFLVLIGFSLTYLGVLRTAEEDVGKYTDLNRVQASRKDLARAGSGFGQDLDVSTTEGAISAIPIGFTYLMLAPFPWQITSSTQLMTLPDMLIWWSVIPFVLMGLWYSIKHRLRSSIAILLFTLMLTISYSIFQGNVGMAYRQRIQIQVFLFMFAGVGWTLSRERKENQERLRQDRNRKAMMKQALQANA